MIVHVLMHDPAVRRWRFFSAGHAAGISGHVGPEYSVHPDGTGAPKKTVPRPSARAGPAGAPNFIWLPRVPATL